MSGVQRGAALCALIVATMASDAIAEEGCTTNPCRFDTPGAWTYVVPDGVTLLHVLLGGGAGGAGGALTHSCPTASNCPGPGAPGGRGALLRADLEVIPGQVLHIAVGASPPPMPPQPDLTGFPGAGGGATSVATSALPAAPGADPRLAVAGGGGGGSGGGGILSPDRTSYLGYMSGFAGGDAGMAGLPQPFEGAFLNALGLVDEALRGGRPGTGTSGGAGGTGNLTPGASGVLATGGPRDRYNLISGAGGEGGHGYYGGGAGGRALLRERGGGWYAGGGGGGGSSYVSSLGRLITLGTNSGAPFAALSYEGVEPAAAPREVTGYELRIDGAVVAGARAFTDTAGGVAGRDQRLLVFRGVRAIGPQLRAWDVLTPAVRERVVLADAMLLSRSGTRPTVASCLQGLQAPNPGTRRDGGRVYDTFSFRYERASACNGSTPDVPGITAEVVSRFPSPELRVRCLRFAPCRGVATVKALSGSERVRFDLPGERQQTWRLDVRLPILKVVVVDERSGKVVDPRIASGTRSGIPAPPPRVATEKQTLAVAGRVQAPPSAPPPYTPPVTIECPGSAAAGDAVKIRGTTALAEMPVTLEFTEPDGTVNTFSGSSNATGAWEFGVSLGKQGTYSFRARSGDGTATCSVAAT